MSGERFRERLRLLEQARANVLPLDEALTRLRSGSLPPRCVTITFDDGFYDFAQSGAPALRAFQYPVTVYLTTHYSSYSLPIVNLVLDYVLWKSKRAAVSFPKFGVSELQSIRNEPERCDVIRRLQRWMEVAGLDTVAKNQVAREIADEAGVDYEQILKRRMLQILSPQEVSDLAQHGVDFELHTHRHRTPQNQKLFSKEIRENRERILEWTGRMPVHFCYPSGYYRPDLASWLDECGVESAAPVSAASPSGTRSR